MKTAKHIKNNHFSQETVESGILCKSFQPLVPTAFNMFFDPGNI